MASSLPLLSPPSSLPHNWIHHVFPSFHGTDVRKALLGHILKEFKSKGIDPFVDNNIKRGKSIGPELIDAIRGSKIAIVLLSKNYASSTWCLDELVEIMRCREVLGQTVMVLFYEVDPTDVKKQTGHFGKVFRKTCKGKKEDNIERWKQALAEVAKIAGYHSINWDNEAEMIEKIATDISDKLNNSTPSSDFNDLVGMASHMINMGPLLRNDLETVKTIGIVGPPGIGKTTIARYIFNHHSKDFQLSVFMENIKARYPIVACSDDYSVKLNLQKQLMSQLLNEMDIRITHLGIAKDRLKFKKVLVILDDVDRSVQIEAMANETCWFGPRSRIIITTQDNRLLKKTDHVYRVDFPSSDEAFEMISMYAFGQKSPKDGFRELAWQVTQLAGKLPLGLRVMGSYFRGMSKEEWTMELPTAMSQVNEEIGSILKFSYDALCDEHKNIFLHIACFFNNESINIVEGCLEKSFRGVVQGLHILAEKSLISKDSEMIRMPNLLVQLGRDIVRKQFVSNPRKHQFLDDARDLSEVLNDDKPDSSRSVIGIDLSSSYSNEVEIEFTSERPFEKLSNLQFLRIDGYYLRNVNLVSQKLRFISWSHFPLPCFPSTFHPKFLVKLDMPKSKLEKLWEETQVLSNLKWINLSHSKSLKELSDLSTATNLCEIYLRNCFRLEEFPSIGNATHLQKVDLICCSNMVKLHSSIGNAIHLQDLDLRYCSSLVKLPYSIGNLIHLRKLNLGYCTGLVELPYSIENLISLEILNLYDCSSLVKLPYSIGNATNLNELNLSKCASMVELPSSMQNLRKLSKLKLKKCSKLQVVLTNLNLESLDKLHLSDSLLKCHPSTSINTGDIKPSETAITKVPCSDIQELDPWIGRVYILST